MVLKDKMLLAEDLVRKDFVSLDQETTAKEALEHFRDFESELEKPSIYYIYVFDEEDLVGVISVKDLLRARTNQTLEELMERDIEIVDSKESLEKVARDMAKTDYQALPVLEEGEMIGIVRHDEMLEVLDNEATEDIFKKAGIIEEIDKSKKVIDSSVFGAVRVRLPWLLFALLGGLMAGGVIEFFESSLNQVMALAFFIPVIMDMGGNVGTQSSTIFVRGLVLGNIESDKALRYLAKEAFTGISIGLITGALAGLTVFLWQGNAMVSVVLFLSMTLTCGIASLLGYIIPWAAHKTGRDPAAVSDPMVTTIKDITALMIYFSLAKALLGI